MKKNSRHKYVVVALRMAGIAGQDKLNGIFDYLGEGRRWSLSIYRTLHEFTAESVRKEIARGADGFIIGIPGARDAVAEIAKTDLPVVAMNIDPGPIAERRQGCVIIKSDSGAVGHEAAGTLLSQGIYKSYGYAAYRSPEEWSRERGRHFRDALAKAGFNVSVFDYSCCQRQTEDRAELIRWLRSLPKPCGILAACDDRAYELIDACTEAGIKVPQEIGILGVNNDPLLCENSNPSISSIQPDFRREGYLAADALERRTKKPLITVGIRRVVIRESTYPMSNSGRLVQKAIAYIEKNAAAKITVGDVAAYLNVSRSLLDLRFRELQGESVLNTILRFRIGEVKRRLLGSRDSIEKISYDCGWQNPNSLKNTFLRVTGHSMRDWRAGSIDR